MSFLCAPGWFRVVIEGKIHPLPRLKDLPLRTISRRLLPLAWSRSVASWQETARKEKCGADGTKSAWENSGINKRERYGQKGCTVWTRSPEKAFRSGGPRTVGHGAMMLSAAAAASRQSGIGSIG